MFCLESCVSLFLFCPPICQIWAFRAFWPTIVLSALRMQERMTGKAKRLTVQYLESGHWGSRAISSSRSGFDASSTWLVC